MCLRDLIYSRHIPLFSPIKNTPMVQYEVTSSSSEEVSATAVMDPMQARPFCGRCESSSEDIEPRDSENDPFVETRILKKMGESGDREHVISRRREIEHTWTVVALHSQIKKAASVPPLNERHLIDFWKGFSNGEVFSLPTMGPGKCDSIQRIAVDVVRDVIVGVYGIDYQIIDCRFSYEYRGGHIRRAININSARELYGLFSEPKVLIFHCEFSSIRGPRLAQCLRNMDRMRNPYPSLTFPEIYIMEGGYKKFYSVYPELCSPKGYVAMDDENYRNLCRKEHKRFRGIKR
jgi:rhodanese-related sulfurtransferase